MIEYPQMARYILCDDCYKRMEENAKKHKEIIRGRLGNSIDEAICDSQGEHINKGDFCWAVTLFPPTSIVNLVSIDTALEWAKDYIK